MKLKILNGILIIDILSLLLIFSIIFIPSTLARVILGLPFILFFPGYTLTAALFVKKEGIDNLERVALSGGISIAVAALIGFGLNYTPWGIRLESVLYSLTSFIFITSVIALIRRARTLESNKFTTEFTLSMPVWESSKFNKGISITLISVIFVAVGILVVTISVPKIRGPFTEFYILGIYGKAQDYPNEYILQNGQVTQIIYGNGAVDAIRKFGTVTLGMVNHEQQKVVYSIKMTINSVPEPIEFGGKTADLLGPIELQNGQKWQQEIGFAPEHIGGNQKVEILLFKGNDTTAEDSLSLWVNASSNLLSINTSSLLNGTVGEAYSQSLAATGGATPYGWTITTGALPAGLLLRSDGVISGTPITAGGPTSVTFHVTDGARVTAIKSLLITINSAPPRITTSSLSNGTVGVAYSQTLAAAGGPGSYAWAIVSGTLPNGLSLSSDGVISGIPTTSGGPTSVTFQTTLFTDRITTATKTFSITIK